MAAPSLRRTIALTVVALVAFAGNSILCRLALHDAAIDPWSFTAIRLASGAALLAPFLWRKREPWSLRGGMALFVYAIAFSLAYVSLDTGTGALLLFGSVQITMIAAGLRRGERPTPVGALGIIAAISGVVLLVLPGVTAPDAAGATLMAAAGIAWGAYSLFGRGAASPALATAGNFALAAPMALLALACASSSLSISSTGALLAISSGAITSGIGYVVWYAVLPAHSATSAAVVQLCVPVLAAVGGVLSLGEGVSTRLLGAGTLTLGGVAMAILSRPTQR